jgi:hypothetical protein
MKVVVEALGSHPRTERRQARVRGQRRIAATDGDRARVGATNSARAAMAVSALASDRVPTHLLGARRDWRGFHCKSFDKPRRA